MKNNQFDSYLKEHLGSLRPEVPPHVWENIAREKDRKKPLALWGFLTLRGIAAAVLILAAGGAFTWFLLHDNAKSADGVTGALASEKNSRANKPQASEGKALDFSQDGTSAVDDVDDIVGANNEDNTDSQSELQARSKNIGAVSGRFSTMVYEPDYAHTTPGYLIESNEQSPLSARNIFSAALLKNNRERTRGFFETALRKNLSIPCPTIEKDAAGNKRYVEIYAGPDYAFREITDLKNGAYAELRKNSTHIISAYSAGVRYTKVFGSGLSIRTGVNYSRINEGFKLVQGHVTQNVYITGTDGDTTGTYTLTGTQYKQSTNKYQSLDIPITAGYELGNGRLHANINAGVLVNVVSRQSGFVVGENGAAVDIGAGKESVYRYKTNTGVSLTGAVSVYYKLNDNLHLLAEPYVRYAMAPVTQSELSLKQKYHAAGLRIGIRTDF